MKVDEIGHLLEKKFFIREGVVLIMHTGSGVARIDPGNNATRADLDYIKGLYFSLMKPDQVIVTRNDDGSIILSPEGR